jgi:hypothetical protein
MGRAHLQTPRGHPNLQLAFALGYKANVKPMLASGRKWYNGEPALLMKN